MPRLQPAEITETDVSAVTDALQNLRAYLKSPLFAEQMAKGKAVAATLADSTDLLNDVIGEVEQEIIRVHVGKAAAIEIDYDHALLFWRVQGRWGLYVLGEHDSFIPCPLKNASRETRIKACHVLSDLARMMEEE